jgi:hypothetical protein
MGALCQKQARLRTDIGWASLEVVVDRIQIGRQRRRYIAQVGEMHKFSWSRMQNGWIIWWPVQEICDRSELDAQPNSQRCSPGRINLSIRCVWAFMFRYLSLFILWPVSFSNHANTIEFKFHTGACLWEYAYSFHGVQIVFNWFVLLT